MPRLNGIGWSECDANAFKGRLVTLCGNAAHGNQNIGLRVIRGGASSGDRIGNDCEVGCLADFSLKVTIDVHDLPGPEIPCLHIKRVEKDHPPAAKHAPIAIIQSIDCGVELIVAANGRQEKFVGLELMPRDWTDGEFCLPRDGLEDAVPRGIRQIEKPLLGKSRVEILESGITLEIASRMRL